MHPRCLPHPVSRKAGCQGARKREAFHFSLVDTTLPVRGLSTCLTGEAPWSQCGPGQRGLSQRLPGNVCLQVLLNVPWLAPLSSATPKCVCNENRRWGCSLLPCHTGPQPGAWWQQQPTHFLKKPGGNRESIAHTTCPTPQQRASSSVKIERGGRQQCVVRTVLPSQSISQRKFCSQALL